MFKDRFVKPIVIKEGYSSAVRNLLLRLLNVKVFLNSLSKYKLLKSSSLNKDWDIMELKKLKTMNSMSILIGLSFIKEKFLHLLHLKYQICMI